MKFIVQDTFSIKKVLIFGGFGLCRFQHKVGMNSFPMRMNVISYGTNSFPWGMYLKNIICEHYYHYHVFMAQGNNYTNQTRFIYIRLIHRKINQRQNQTNSN